MVTLLFVYGHYCSICQPWDASSVDSVMVASSHLTNGPSVMPYTPPGMFSVAYAVSLGWLFVGFGWKFVDSNVSTKPSNVKGMTRFEQV